MLQPRAVCNRHWRDVTFTVAPPMVLPLHVPRGQPPQMRKNHPPSDPTLSRRLSASIGCRQLGHQLTLERAAEVAHIKKNAICLLERSHLPENSALPGIRFCICGTPQEKFIIKSVVLTNRGLLRELVPLIH